MIWPLSQDKGGEEGKGLRRESLRKKNEMFKPKKKLKEVLFLLRISPTEFSLTGFSPNFIYYKIYLWKLFTCYVIGTLIIIRINYNQ